MESKDTRVVVKPTYVEFLSEFRAEVTGRYPATHVGVELRGSEIWYKNVTPFFVGLRAATGMVIPKPFYAFRIDSAKKAAEKIAQSAS